MHSGAARAQQSQAVSGGAGCTRLPPRLLPPLPAQLARATRQGARRHQAGRSRDRGDSGEGGGSTTFSDAPGAAPMRSSIKRLAPPERLYTVPSKMLLHFPERGLASVSSPSSMGMKPSQTCTGEGSSGAPAAHAARRVRKREEGVGSNAAPCGRAPTAGSAPSAACRTATDAARVAGRGWAVGAAAVGPAKGGWREGPERSAAGRLRGGGIPGSSRAVCPLSP